MKIVDMHCDTISLLLNHKRNNCDQGLKNNSLHIDLTKMQKSKYLLQNFALFVNMKHCENPFEEAIHMTDLYYEELEKNKDIIQPVFKYSDIITNEKEGKMSALLTLEEGAIIKGDIALLHTMYRLGARMMTLTWNFPNELGYPNLDANDKKAGKPMVANTTCGLTEKGIEIIQEMERLGMIIDVSHLSDAGFYDVLQYTKAPFVASHSNARAVCSHIRNLTDDMIKQLANRGGVTGINLYPFFLVNEVHGQPTIGTIDSIVTHIKHIVNVGGYDCIGLGTDFDGIEGHDEIKDASYMPLLEDALTKAGFTEGQIEKIFSKNVLRVYEEILR